MKDIRYSVYYIDIGQIPLCQPDFLWLDNNYTIAYSISDSKRASKIPIEEREGYGRTVLGYSAEDFVKAGKNAHKKLDKKIEKRKEALCRKGCIEIVKFVRQRFFYEDDLVEYYTMIGMY
jgi:hypothetical protein